MKTAITNKSKPVFLTAAWRKLVMANYIIDPSILAEYLPSHNEIDLFNGKCYISLVGFLFDEVKLKGIRIPFHDSFPEVNLRFYVKTKGEAPKRGVVFVSEIVTKPAIAWIANAFYQEHYTATAMQKEWTMSDDSLNISYRWKTGTGGTAYLFLQIILRRPLYRDRKKLSSSNIISVMQKQALR